MNPMRQRDELKKMCAAGVFKEGLLKVCLESPVFLYQSEHKHDFTDEETQWIETNVMEMMGRTAFPKAVPFPAFRISSQTVRYSSSGWLVLITPSVSGVMMDGRIQRSCSGAATCTRAERDR